MSTDTKTPDAMHLRSVRLENVRAFGSTQTLRLTDDSGIVARWTLILGENGVGKTTLIQVMAAMRPIPAFENDDDLMKSDDAGPPTFIRAELSSHENEEIVGFLREDAIGNMLMSAVFVTETDALVEVGAEIVGKAGRDFEAASFSKAEYSLRADGPLIFGYGASRHAGRDNLSAGGNRTATTSLAAELVDLYDAEEVIENLAIAARLDPEGHQGKDFKRFEKLRIVVASLLPECSADAIEWRGPRLAGRDPYQSGVYVRTPSGMTAFAKLSSGYKVTFALIVDLAWRLYNTYPYSANPFEESAIVLIDEIELHLHPRWQRQLRSQLLAHFPNVQFVATTHSPVMAQESLSAGANVCVLRWVGSEVQILNDPLPRNEWRFDQVLASELFGFASDRSPTAEALLDERLGLIRSLDRSPEDERRLRELDEFVASLPTSQTPSSQHLEDMMRNFLRDFPETLAR